ncbi:MAG TPA: 6-hydroxymethylpterin diphosphokinase MptE-like protein [Rectinemataceae bacterium]|nr:6-hydroxymethylpterin diphosphokinase MptE-like protein [Rectinemataceae bacterium]
MGSGDRLDGDRPADPAIVFCSGEENILAKGRLLYPERGPSRFARRMAEVALEESRRSGPARLILVLSPGLWFGVTELLAGLPADGALLCVETDPELAALSRAHMPAGLLADRRVGFVAGRDPRAWVEAAARLGRFRRCHPVRLSGGADLDQQSYRDAAFVLDEDFSAYWRNRASLAAMGRLWVRNIFRNLSRLKEMAQRTLTPISGATLVCGAGPSLETALPLVARHRDKLFVVAADTAAGPLALAGIVPDLVVCLEAQIWNLRDFLPLEGAEFALLADLSSHPSSFGIPGAINSLSIVRIFAGALMERLRSLGLPALDLPPLGSVGVQALHVAWRLGADPLFVAGLDFAFEPGKTHARGSPALLADLATASRLSPLGSRPLATSFREGVRPANREGSLTDPVLSRYAEQAAEELGISGAKVFDLRGDFGLPLGAERLDAASANRLLGELPSRRAWGRGVQDSGDTAARAREFLAAESKRLLVLEKMLRGGSRPDDSTLLGAIAELDYLLWPMPDAERIAALPQDLLNRVLVETEYWLAQLADITAL